MEPQRSCPLCHRQNARRFLKVDDFQIVSCNVCRFVFLANPLDENQEQKLYETYNTDLDLTPYGTADAPADLQHAWQMNDRRLQWLSQHQSTGRLLDVGCGRGLFLSQALAQRYKGEGVEISHKAAQLASEFTGAVIHVCNLERGTPFDGPFDIITAWHVLEHFTEPRAALRHLHALLAPNGLLAVEVPNLNSLKFKVSRPSKRWQGGNHPRYHRSFFIRETLERMLESADFFDYETIPITYSHSTGMRVLKRTLQRLNADSFLTVMVKK